MVERLLKYRPKAREGIDPETGERLFDAHRTAAEGMRNDSLTSELARKRMLMVDNNYTIISIVLSLLDKLLDGRVMKR